MIAYLGMAGCWDLAHRRVPNSLNLAAAMLAVVLGACRGAPFLLVSCKGMAMGAGIGLVPFALRMLGGGDVKSLMALGAFTGPGMVWYCFIGALMAGGILGVLFLLPSLPFLKGRRRPGAPARTLPFTTLLALACYLLLLII
jgi:prepilin peptidase CpaA